MKKKINKVQGQASNEISQAVKKNSLRKLRLFIISNFDLIYHPANILFNSYKKG